MSRHSLWYRLSFGLTILGAAVSGYLLARLFRLLAGPAALGGDVCSALFGAGCDDILLSASSWLLGIPFAGWGLLYFATLAYLLVLASVLRESFREEATLAALLLSAAGVLASLALAFVILSGRAPLCPLCLVTHAVNLGLFFCLWRTAGLGLRGIGERLKAAWRHLASEESDDPRLAPWKLVGFGSVALLALVLYQWVFIQADLHRQTTAQGPDPRLLLAAFEAAPQQDIPLDANAPRLGPDGAGVRLVVFSSFGCPGCRRFAGIAPRLVERFDGDLQVVFQHFPLSTSCNPALTTDLHPRSCQASRAAEAARRQGAFWPYHDGIFASGHEPDEETLRQLAAAAGLDVERFEADRHSEGVHQEVSEEIELGLRLGVDATPAVFLDGRRAPDVGEQALEILISYLLH